MNATPRPWTVRKNDVGRCVIEHQPVGGLVSHLAVLKDAWLCKESGGTVDANAQLIVRAVNSYDAMREALEELVRLLPQPANRQYAESRVLYDAVANAKAALALEKGDQDTRLPE